MLSAAHIWLCSDQSSVRGHEAEGSVQHLGFDAAVRETFARNVSHASTRK